MEESVAFDLGRRLRVIKGVARDQPVIQPRCSLVGPNLKVWGDWLRVAHSVILMTLRSPLNSSLLFIPSFLFIPRRLVTQRSSCRLVADECIAIICHHQMVHD
jgi:hypothetical protein